MSGFYVGSVGGDDGMADDLEHLNKNLLEKEEEDDVVALILACFASIGLPNLMVELIKTYHSTAEPIME
jgi:hypothetical protein